MNFFRRFTKDEPYKRRTDFESLINEPVEVWVGGLAGSEPKKVMIAEPSNMQLGKHISMAVNGIVGVLNENREIIELISDPSKITKKHKFLFASVPEAFRDIVADLVGEDADYVENKMTGKQTTAVLATYLDLIGFDYLKETFEWALQGWNEAATPAATKIEPIKPPTPVEPSLKSQAN